MNGVFTPEAFRPIRDGLTVSRNYHLGGCENVCCFSLGQNTSISSEYYDCAVMYIGNSGICSVSTGTGTLSHTLSPDTFLIVPGGTLCGMNTASGTVYTEIILGNEEYEMNPNVKTNEIFALKNLIAYEEGSIANMDIVRNDSMKYALMAFDSGTGLTPHRAPGDAILFALEGSAVIGYEGTDYPIREGECFRFEKNGLHSVTASGRFKMALLLILA